MYKITILPAVEKLLERMRDRALREQLIAAIQSLATNPHPSNSTKLVGNRDLYRLRRGDWRIIYEIRAGELIIVVTEVDHRRDIYKKR